MSVTLDPALNILNLALSGDRGALSFLDRTSSIYVLDVTDSSKPKTYGGWNFIHQAMTELERHEARFGASAVGLNSHVQLLAAMSQRTARRSPVSDRYLVNMCIENAAQYHATASEAQKLVELNSELREIVMGRIAAMVFDFSFHNPHGPHLSAFADPVAMDGLCAVLSVNAVSSGPKAISHLLVDWIIPSARALPPFAVACVILHLALEGRGKLAPAGTKDLLQRLSALVMSIVLAPVLRDAILECSDTQDEDSSHARNGRVAAACIRAIHNWCAATDLTLPQIKHVVGKVEINLVELVSDAMYSDSELVVEAMAELMDGCLYKRDQDPTKDRMTQTRYIMDVDEAAFQSISPVDLFRIESTEMDSIVWELVSAIGLQRLRFVDRQAKGDHAACRCLARIAAALCNSAMDALAAGQSQGDVSGMVDLLAKAAEHVSVHICSIALDPLRKLVVSDTNFSMRLLPSLQRRAIIPHILAEDRPTLNASEICGVDFHEFRNFRDTALHDALVACFVKKPDHYMESCTSAVEEFCSASPTDEVSFQMEAALFCLCAVADVSLQPGHSGEQNVMEENGRKQRLLRCIELIGNKPVCIMTSPLTLAQACIFVKKYGGWCALPGNETALRIATELCFVSLGLATSSFVTETFVQESLCEASVSPFSEAAQALHILMIKKPAYFAAEAQFKALQDSWNGSFNAINRANTLNVEDRVALCKGICCVIASLPDHERQVPYRALSFPSIDCLATMTKMADNIVASPHATGSSLASTLTRVAQEILVLAAMTSAIDNDFAERLSLPAGEETKSSGRSASIAILRRAWPSISHIAETFNSDEHISEALAALFVGCVRHLRLDDEDIALFQEFCTLASSILTNSDGSHTSLHSVCEFVKEMMLAHGETVEKHAAEIVDSTKEAREAAASGEVGRLLEGLLLSLVETIRASLGADWTGKKEQGNGQQPFECRSDRLSGEERQSSTEGLAEVLPILTACALKSPLFLVHLPAVPSGERRSERLVERAVESAVPVLLDSDIETSLSAMSFLQAVVQLSALSTNDTIQQIVTDTLSRVRRDMCLALFRAFCGKIHQVGIESAAELCYSLLHSSPSADVRSFVTEALQQETFLLGDHARRLTLQFLEGCAKDTVDLSQLKHFVHDVWILHQVDDPGSVAGSDAVVRLAANYAV